MPTIIQILIFTTISHLFLLSCDRAKNSGSDTGIDSVAEKNQVPGNFTVDNVLSVVAWEGKVVGVYGHNGIIDIQEGFISTLGEEITGGKIVIDMKSIVPLDSSSYQDRDGSRITDLQHHLTTGDFFLTDKYPTATFDIKSQKNNKLSGDLTVRGITHEETATLSYLEVLPEGFSADGTLVFDRQKYGIKWEHPITDYVLSDNVKVDLKIVARRSEDQ